MPFCTVGYICAPPVYHYAGWYFEDPAWCGPWPLRRDGVERKRAGREFWRMYDEFTMLSLEERKVFRVSGGCIPYKVKVHGG